MLTAVLAAKQADEGETEVTAGAGVDDGVHEAVAVAKPECDLEQPYRSLARSTQCFCVYTT
jgi:hypothetical protein